MATKKKEPESQEENFEQVQYVTTMYVNSANKFDAWLAAGKEGISRDFKYWSIEILKAEPQYRTYRISLVGPVSKIHYFIRRVGEVTRI